MAQKGVNEGLLTIAPGRPLEISKQGGRPRKSLPKELRQIGKTVKAYVQAIERLVSTKYLSAKDQLPAHLASAWKPVVALCRDGLILRFDKTPFEGKALHLFVPEEGLAKLVPALSEQVLFCTSESAPPPSVTAGPTINLHAVNPTTGDSKPLLQARPHWTCQIDTKPDLAPSPSRKPYCAASITSSIELGLLGEMLPVEKGEKGRKFQTRSLIELPVGWCCIEVYPFLDVKAWKPEYAELWAENNILVSLVRRQFLEQEFNRLDPNIAARTELTKVLKAFKNLLDSNPDREEELQVFLRAHPMILCPTQSRCWPKLALGAKETDFVIREATGHYLLVELERSTLRLFRLDGNPTQELTRALGQIRDWKRYLEDNLSTAQRELELTGISANPNAVVVMGRSNSLSDRERRSLATMQNEMPRTKILTYDDMFHSTKAVIENLLGPINLDADERTKMYYLSE